MAMNASQHVLQINTSMISKHMHPQCIADCSTNTYNKYIHHDGESCVRSCRLLYPMSYLNSAETKC